MEKLILTTKLNIKDYIKVNYHLFYRKFAVKFMTGIGLLMILMVMFSSYSFVEFPWVQLIVGLFLTVGLPIQIFLTSKRNYNSNPRISEIINYEFDKENIQMTGESFNSKLTWDKIYNVTENKYWILIWQNRQIANVVPKRDFKKGELEAFKDIVISHVGLKSELKKL